MNLRMQHLTQDTWKEKERERERKREKERERERERERQTETSRESENLSNKSHKNMFAIKVVVVCTTVVAQEWT